MNIRHLKALEQQVRQLSSQGEQDPRVLISLMEIHERLRGVPRSGRQAMIYARIQYDLGVAFFAWPAEEGDAHLQRAAACFEEALRYLSLETAPPVYADAQSKLGDLYQLMPAGDQAAHLQRALACYREALRVWTPEVDLLAYTTLQSKLGDLYQLVPAGDQAANLQLAIACYHEALRFWTSDAYPRVYAAIQGNLGDIYSQQPGGVADLHQAIACYQEALRSWDAAMDPIGYAVTQNNLGKVYSDLPTGERAAHLQQAIACYQEALHAWTPETFPFYYAATQNNLGAAYRELLTGERAAHLQQAIACYKESLRFWTPETAPLEYAATCNNLGNVYSTLPGEDQAANLEQAIIYYQDALRFWTPETAPLDYASAQNNLGNAYSAVPTGERAANLGQAITCYQEALRFWTPETAPLDYASAQNNLGGVYSHLPTGDRAANVQQAIACYESALQFWTPDADPLHHAIAQNNLGIAYADLFIGDRSANVRRAIACYEAALRFWTPEAAPLEYAATQNNLGGAYTRLPTGDRAAHVHQAIACFQEALRFWTPESDPLHYAAAQNNLGEAYKRWPTDDPAVLEQAIACFQEALRYWTPESDPPNYAIAQHNLGSAYAHLTSGDRAATLGQAIACYEEALRVRTAESAPEECRASAQQLATLFFKQHAWSRALATFQVAIEAGEVLYRADLSAESKASEMVANAELYRHAAYAAVQCGQSVRALELLEQGKTRVLSEALRVRLVRPARVPEADWAAYQEAAVAVRVLQATIRSERGSVSPQTYAARVQEAHEATMALERAIERVRLSAPAFLRTIDLSAARALLPDEATCFVLFCITTQGSLGLLVTRAEPEVRTVAIPAFTYGDLFRLLVTLDEDEKVLGGWLGTYQRYLAERTPAARDEWQTTMRHTLEMLGQRLVAPILAALPKSIEHIICLSSAQLFLFPLHAIPLEGAQTTYVGDRYRVSYAPSIEVLATTQARAIADVAPQLYAVINPTADTHLAFAAREGAVLAELFAHSVVDEGRRGTKQRVMTSLGGKSYLHFACHGHYDLVTPMVSGLDFADGRLTLVELQESNVDLSATRLVALSACETGMSDVIQGSAEEYVGMPAGFMVAGVPCVLSSLWAVSDLSTALVMERFYSNHLKERMEFPAALREAQQWVRTLDSQAVLAYAEHWYQQSGRRNAVLWQWYRHYRMLVQQRHDRPFEHPYYWAAFTVNGG